MISATTINQIINYISIEGGEYKNIFNKLVDSAQTRNTDVLSDYWQELMLILLEKGEVVVEAYNNNYFKYLFIKIIKNQFHSSTSPMFKKYKKSEVSNGEEIIIEDVYDEYNEDKFNDDILKINKIKLIVNKLPYLNRELFNQKFFLNKTYRQITAETGIPLTSVFWAVRLAKNILKKQMS